MIFYRGDKILQLADRIVFGQVSVAGFYYILIHVGINDLSEWLQKDLIWPHTIHDLLNRYKALYKVLRRRNKSAIIMFSSILPYADKFDQFFPLICSINFALEKWCAKSGGTRLFMASHAQFLRKGKPKHELFARVDGLHPNGVGTDDLQSFFQHVLTSEYVYEQTQSKRVKTPGYLALLRDIYAIPFY